MQKNVEELPAEYLTEITLLLDQLDARPKQVIDIGTTRRQLGDFTSVICFKALMTGLEDVLGEQSAQIVFTRAGKLRGEQLVNDWGVSHLNLTPETMRDLLNAALGRNGTRLCAVRNVELFDGGMIVNTTDTICSAGEKHGSSRRCTFTLGAVWGAIETLTGKRYTVQQTKSVLGGDDFDQFACIELQ